MNVSSKPSPFRLGQRSFLPRRPSARHLVVLSNQLRVFVPCICAPCAVPWEGETHTSAEPASLGQGKFNLLAGSAARGFLFCSASLFVGLAVSGCLHAQKTLPSNFPIICFGRTSTWVTGHFSVRAMVPFFSPSSDLALEKAAE